MASRCACGCLWSLIADFGLEEGTLRVRACLWTGIFIHHLSIFATVLVEVKRLANSQGDVLSGLRVLSVVLSGERSWVRLYLQLLVTSLIGEITGSCAASCCSYVSLLGFVHGLIRKVLG